MRIVYSAHLHLKQPHNKSICGRQLQHSNVYLEDRLSCFFALSFPLRWPPSSRKADFPRNVILDRLLHQFVNRRPSLYLSRTSRHPSRLLSRFVSKKRSLSQFVSLRLKKTRYASKNSQFLSVRLNKSRFASFCLKPDSKKRTQSLES